MRNGMRVNGAAPHRGGISPGNGYAYGAAPASDQELRLASDIADLIGRRSQPRAPQQMHQQQRSGGPRPGGLAAALGNLQRDAIAEAERAAERSAALESLVPPPPPPSHSPPHMPVHAAPPPRPAYAMAGMARITDADRVMPQATPGTWIKKAKRRRTLGAVKAVAAWMTSLAIIGIVVATAAVLLGVPRDLHGLSQLATFLLKH